MERNRKWRVGGRRAVSVSIALAALLSCSACASIDATGPALIAHQEAIAREAGPLETASVRQDGPLVSEYFDKADALEASYRFPGTRIFGMIEGASNQLGCVLLLGNDSPSRGTIIALHGYNAYSAFNLSALYRLASDGWAVVAVDLPGHGNSSGPRGYIGDFSEYADAVRDVVAWTESQKTYVLPRPLVLLGHSTGGAAVLETLWDYPAGIDRAVLLAPLLAPRRFALNSAFARVSSAFTPAGPIPGPKQGYLCFDRMPFAWVRALGVYRSRIGKRAKIEIPVLAVQGDADNALNWKANIRAISSVAPNAELRVLSGKGHVLFDRSSAQEETLAAIKDFLDGAGGHTVE